MQPDTCHSSPIVIIRGAVHATSDRAAAGMGSKATARCLLGLVAAALLFCCASAATTGRQDPDNVAEVAVTDPDLARVLEETKAAAGKPRLFHENLVQERPLVLPDKWNWYSYNYSTFRNADEPTDTFLGLQTVERGNLEAGVLNLTLEWKPLANLTSEMVEWMFGNLHKKALSPFDNKTYPMYTILHPVDHITFLAKPDPIRKGSTYTFIENPNSECTYQPDSFDAPYVCAPDRRGFTVDSPEAVWRTFPQTNATLVVDRLDRNSCVWYRERELPHFGKRVVITSKMTWEDTPDGLVMRASRLAGVMAPNKTDQFETESPELLRQANEVVRVAYLDGNFNNNITQSAYAFALHWGQEWTGLKDWLPQVFASSKKELTAAAAAVGGSHPDDVDHHEEDKQAAAAAAAKSPNAAGSVADSSVAAVVLALFAGMVPLLH